MCDCSAITEILEYEGNIPQICRWLQELLGYQFTVVHRNYKIMMDVDDLSRRFGSLISTHCAIAYMLHYIDIKNRPDAYIGESCRCNGRTKIQPQVDSTLIAPSILIQSNINRLKHVYCTERQVVKHGAPSLFISSYPVLIASATNFHHSRHTNTETLIRTLDIQDSLSVNYLCIDDVSGSLPKWSKTTKVEAFSEM